MLWKVVNDCGDRIIKDITEYTNHIKTETAVQKVSEEDGIYDTDTDRYPGTDYKIECFYISAGYARLYWRTSTSTCPTAHQLFRTIVKDIIMGPPRTQPFYA